MEPNYSWIYLLIFLIIPLSRIIPRLIANRKPNNENFSQFQNISNNGDEIWKAKIESRQNQNISDEMKVLGNMHNGANTFDKIQKQTKITVEELNRILEDLERKEMIRVVKKSGMFGEKIELYSTDKGFREYYS
jgi:CRP-like cAMP-binding protein